MGQMDPEVNPHPYKATQIFHQIYTDLNDDQKPKPAGSAEEFTACYVENKGQAWRQVQVNFGYI